MGWKLYRESEVTTPPKMKIDYTKIKFPSSPHAEILDSDENIYAIKSDELDEANADWLNGRGIDVVVEVEARGHWWGKYWPGNREEPPEYPEYEIDDVSSSLVGMELSDGNDVIDITDSIPTKKQAIADGNEKWYEEYTKFISNISGWAEDAECERLQENPPEPDEPDYDDYREYWDDDDN